MSKAIEAAHTSLVQKAPAELVSAEPRIVHYEAMRERTCSSLRLRLARFLRCGWQEWHFPAGLQESGQSQAKGQEAGLGTPNVVHSPPLHRGEFGGDREGSVTSRILDAIEELRSHGREAL